MTMSPEEAACLQTYLSQSVNYLEFGAGQSTQMAVATPSIQSIDCVESNPQFIQNQLLNKSEIQAAKREKRLQFHPIDIGPLASWGSPQNEEKKHLWPNYCLHIFNRPSHHDLVLIDGRFRVACALSCLLNTPPHCKLMIHDFWNREEYYILLKFFKTLSQVDTLGVFEKKPPLDHKELQYLLKIYQYCPHDKTDEISFRLESPTDMSTPTASPTIEVKPPQRISKDGAWCWFQDPRALYLKGQYQRSFVQWITQSGELQIGCYDHDKKAHTRLTLKSDWGVDDHNVGAFLLHPDKRLSLFYTQHEGNALYCKTTRHPEDFSLWNPEIQVCQGQRISYAHPAYLKSEQQYFVFWRGDSWMPHFSYSEDGVKWCPQQQLLQLAGSPNKKRPYLKLRSDGESAIHIILTDGHPRDEPLNSIYYLRYQHGGFYHANGRQVGTLDTPLILTDLERIYDARQTQERAWIWDIAYTSEGAPVIVYTRFVNELQHRYYYARWTGQSWAHHLVTEGGSWFPQTQAGHRETEPHYSGGIALHPAQPHICYLSRPVNRIFEIEKWSWQGSQKGWHSSPITQNSAQHNVRPLVPQHCPSGWDHLFWMHGKYLHYTYFQTQIHFRTS